MKTVILTKNQKPTPEQIAQIREAAKRHIIFDEDSPELTPEMYEAFQKAAIRRNQRKKEEMLQA